MVKHYSNDDEWPDAKDQGYEGPGWYFWDETETYVYGPYATEEIAKEKLAEYAEWLNKGDEQ